MIGMCLSKLRAISEYNIIRVVLSMHGSNTCLVQYRPSNARRWNRPYRIWLIRRRVRLSQQLTKRRLDLQVVVEIQLISNDIVYCWGSFGLGLWSMDETAWFLVALAWGRCVMDGTNLHVAQFRRVQYRIRDRIALFWVLIPMWFYAIDKPSRFQNF